MFRRLIVAAFLLIGTQFAHPAFAAGFKDPVAFVKALYALPELWLSASGDAASRQKYLSPALSKLVADNKKLEPENQLDYDALADGQDYDISELKVILIQSAGGKAVVRAEFKNFDSPEKITLQLVTVGGEWRLDDVQYGDDRSLADDLQFMNGN